MKGAVKTAMKVATRIVDYKLWICVYVCVCKIKGG